MKNDIEESKNLSYVLSRHLPQNLLILFDMEDGNNEVDGSIVYVFNTRTKSAEDSYCLTHKGQSWVNVI